MSKIVKYSPDQIALIKRTVAQGATDDELKLFIYDCQRRNVHPLDRLLHFTVHKSKDGTRKYTPVTSIDLMRSRAAETGQMAGSDDAQFTYDEDLNTKVPYSAHVTVYRLTGGQRYAYTATARWSEYVPDKAFMWHKMPYTMLAKCAEALALRKAFPQELAGLYAKEEMDQANVITTPATPPTPVAAGSLELSPPQQEPAAEPPRGAIGGGLSLLDMAREAARRGYHFYYDAFWHQRSAVEKKQIAAIKDELNALMKEADEALNDAG